MAAGDHNIAGFKATSDGALYVTFDGTTIPNLTTGIILGPTTSVYLKSDSSGGLLVRNVADAAAAPLTAAAITGTTVTATTQFNVGSTDAVVSRNAASRVLVSGDGTGTASGKVGWVIGNYATTSSGLWTSNVTPSSTNYTFYSDGQTTIANASVSVYQKIADSTITLVTSAGVAVTGLVSASSRINNASFTVGTLPSAATAGGMIYVSDAGGNGPCMCCTNGTNWKRSDNASTTVS